MKQRSPIAVFLLPVVTFGIYSWYWLVKTKGEMNKMGEDIPTVIIWLIPFVGSIWWLWKYSEGVEHVTHEKLGGVLSFVLLFLLGTIGQAIIQDSFNKTTAVNVVNQATVINPTITVSVTASAPESNVNSTTPTTPTI
jgi:hypothetical protein